MIYGRSCGTTNRSRSFCNVVLLNYHIPPCQLLYFVRKPINASRDFASLVLYFERHSSSDSPSYNMYRLTASISVAARTAFLHVVHFKLKSSSLDDISAAISVSVLK